MRMNGYGNLPPIHYGANSALPNNSFGQIFANTNNLHPALPLAVGGGANSWGPAPLLNHPFLPVSDFTKAPANHFGHNHFEPVGDLYNWGSVKDDPKTEEPKRRRQRREDPEPPQKHVYDEVKGRVWGDPHFDGADAEKYDIQGKAGVIYNILSDAGVQVNAKFASFERSATANVMGELGFRINGDNVKIVHTADNKKLVEINGQAQDMSKDWSKNGVTWKGGKLTVEADSTAGESWKFDVLFQRHGSTNYLDLGIKGNDIGKNSTTTAGLWGHSLNNENTGDRAGGGGVILGPDGKPISKSAKEGDAEHNAALALYVEKDLFSTNSKWSTY